ncbi:histidine phosphatase family protein [Listeria sp. PSOL-1]|uniref:histidine phosphatase family protein n=1 Tax=Listeria sp. PSOL-1 TaxID=1844999 RepID=UPI0013D6D82C|nr:histidine phosphatase family protein [Listeria sp. PSOL-1]
MYFVRHGKTEWNLTGQMQGWGDSPLVSEGIEGAKRVGEALSNITFNQIYSSSSKRTQDTARLILNDPSVEIKPMEEFREMGFGSWEGVRVTELDQKFALERQLFLTDPITFDAKINGGETYFQLEKRLLSGLEKIKAEQTKGNILVVSHGMALTLLLHLLSGGTLAEHRKQGTKIVNTSISVVEFKQDGHKVIELNNVDHLLNKI